MPKTDEASAELLERLAVNIRSLRVKARLSQEAFAQKSDISRPTISRIENGDHNPRLSTIEHLANALGVDLVTLLQRPLTRRPLIVEPFDEFDS